MRVQRSITNDDRYSGSNNTLVMETESTLEFTCQFQLQMYPVDRQNCFLLFTLPGLSKDFGLLIKDEDGVTFEGSRYLLEYELVGETLTEEMEGRFSLMQGEILDIQKRLTFKPYIDIRLEFRNLYGYYIGNTFVPSLFLVIIVYLTLYFDINDFEDRVMVSLTSLLVLATFFTQTSSSIPRTSYLKLIDAWYVALICQNFLVIVSLVVVENLRLRDKPMTTRVTPMGVKSYEGDEVLLYKKVNFFLKFVFPLMLFGILTSFFSFWSRN
nr:glutamate-gated chloride channel-like [Penaeus vannamei]